MISTTLTRLEQAFIEDCYNSWGWLDDSSIDYDCPKWKGVKSSLEQKGIIYQEEDDLYGINPEYDHLFV